MDFLNGLMAPRFKRCYFCSPFIERRMNAAPDMGILPELAACKDLKCGVKKRGALCHLKEG